MRPFCWECHRPRLACFCAIARPFVSSVDFALVVHPSEVSSTVGTAWILRKSISNLKWIRSPGTGLDQNARFLELISAPERAPLLLFPGKDTLELNHASIDEWRTLVPEGRRPLFVVLDGTWSQARAMLGKSQILRSLPRVSFETERPSEYQFKRQPQPLCLSSVEGVHRVIEILASRGWAASPPEREHDQALEIFRGMVRFQLEQERNLRTVSGRRGPRIPLPERQAPTREHDVFLSEPCRFSAESSPASARRPK